jgi:aminoglycoside 2'-N-acetyltransferase I
MTELGLARTDELDAATLADVRALLDRAFDGDFSEHDWEHALGGVHALVREGGALVGHAALVPRRLLHAGRALCTGYVEALAVAPHVRGRGHGTALMRAIEPELRRGFELGALSASDPGARLYGALGWTRWLGPTFALGPQGAVRTPEDDRSIHVLPVSVALEVRGALTCDWRAGDPW